jgi:single-strand DNA-binding protein
MFNLVVLTGRLTSDVELKTTTNGVSVCSFSIAVERRYKQGEERQADFINIVAWRSSAEFICKYFKKGSMIGIEGSIQTRKYQDRDGNNRTAFEVVANNVQFVEFKKADNNSDNNAPVDPENDSLNQVQDRLNEFQDLGNVYDEDLPF